MNIVLIGFMGVGKGRTARALAAKTDLYALDCDDLIESYCNLKVKEIFELHGEHYFRELERKTAVWLEHSVDNAILSTGGGFFQVPNINRLGSLVYLHNKFDDIINRIKKHPNGKQKIKKRPLLKDMAAAKRLYKERLPIYRSIADIEVSVQDKTSDEVAGEILTALAGKGKNILKTQ